MAKKEIKMLHLESLLGIEILQLSNTIAAEQLTHVAEPHRHDHYCCFFITDGAMNYNVNFQQATVAACSLLISCPGQIHNFSAATEIKGWGMAFYANLIDENARNLMEQSLADYILIALAGAAKEWFLMIFELMYTTAKDKQPLRFETQLLQSLLNAFFYKATALFKAQEDNKTEQHALQSVNRTNQFNQLLKENFLSLKKPADYALKMNVTVSYLNDTIKAVTGFSTTYLIQQEVFREAQRQLFYSSKSIKEIAYALGYEDYKYFIRLFGKTVGCSPTRFRKNNTL